MTAAEKYFKYKRSAVNAASSVNELIEIMASDVKDPSRAGYEKNLRKSFNKKHRGDLNKSRQECLSLIAEFEENYFTL